MKMIEKVIDRLNRYSKYKYDNHFDGDGFDFLIGLSIVDVIGNTLVLSNGYKLHLYENEGCGGCSNGWSELPNLELLKNTDNIITDVKVDYNKNYFGDTEEFKVFVLYHDKRFDIVLEGGDDGYGNGYYGGGFYLTVENPELLETNN